MRAYRFIGGLVLVAIALGILLLHLGSSATATAFGVVGLALIAVSRR